MDLTNSNNEVKRRLSISKSEVTGKYTATLDCIQHKKVRSRVKLAEGKSYDEVKLLARQEIDAVFARVK